MRFDFAWNLRQSLKQFRVAPGFAAVSVLSLALGIGATTTVFSIIYGVLLNPYPYRGADRMVQLRLFDASGRHNYLLLNFPQFAKFRTLGVLDGAIAMDPWDMASTGDALPESVHTVHFSPDAFAYLGVPPLVGSTFAPTADSGAALEHVAVLSWPYWQRRYGGDPAATGKVLQLDHQDFVILGVMPPRFRWENGEVFTPLAATSDPNRIYMVSARLKAGVTYQRAEAAMQPLLETFARETPQHFPRGFHVRVRSMAGEAAGSFRGTLWLLFGAVGVLLLVGCSNISILFLARGTGRMHEFAVRAALGANRRRLAGQLFTESLALAVAGGIGGVLLAVAGIPAVLSLLPANTFPPEASIHLNLPVLLFSTALAIATGIGFGVSPALRFSMPHISEAMRSAGYRTTPGSRSRRTHRLLLAAQVALTILLLAGAGSAARGFMALYHTRLGYDPGNVLTVSLSLPDGSYTRYDARAAFYRAIEQRVAALPGVRSAAVSLFQIPPEGGVRQTVEVMGRTAAPGQTIDIEEVTGEYFSALRIPLERGRTWSLAENDRAAHVALINQEAARRFFPGRNPIGQKIRLPEFKAFTAWIVATRDSTDWLEIIGVAGDTPNRGLREPAAAAAYVPYTLVMGDSMNLVARTEGAPLTMVRAIREGIRAVDPGQPVAKSQTAEDLLRVEGWGRQQFIASLFLIFAAIALALAVTGLYSVVSYATSVRLQEFGIRMALGAGRSQVVRLVLRSALITVMAGVAVGLTLSVAANDLMAQWAAGSVYDPEMLSAIVLLLTGASALAAWIPARRAAACDPMRVLRGE
jgi:putative ABC transport system permease protein